MRRIAQAVQCNRRQPDCRESRRRWPPESTTGPYTPGEPKRAQFIPPRTRPSLEGLSCVRDRHREAETSGSATPGLESRGRYGAPTVGAEDTSGKHWRPVGSAPNNRAPKGVFAVALPCGKEALLRTGEIPFNSTARRRSHCTGPSYQRSIPHIREPPCRRNCVAKRLSVISRSTSWIVDCKCEATPT
jgi:hypothetical protein